MTIYKNTCHALFLMALFTLIAIPFATHPTEATVGGPTTVYDFRYNPADESVYYVEQDHGGRGCPPELKRISLHTGAVSTVFSCDQGEALAEQNDNYNHNSAREEIDRIISDFKPLTQIHLNNNNIAVDVDFLRVEKLETGDFVMQRHFSSTVFQNNTQVSKFSITGCELDQPFLFAGYAIPGFNQKIILLSSAKSDCFEGGYIGENLHVVGGVSNLDKTEVSNSYKNSSPLELSSATRVVYESEEITPATSSPTPTPDETDEGTNNESDENENEDTNENQVATDTDEISGGFEMNMAFILLLVAVAAIGGIVLGNIFSKK